MKKCNFYCSEEFLKPEEQCKLLSNFLGNQTALSIYLSVYLSVYISVCLSICLSAYLSVCLSICLYIYLSVYISVCLSFCLFIYLSIYTCVHLNDNLSIYLYILFLSICLSLYMNVGCRIVFQTLCLFHSYFSSFSFSLRLIFSNLTIEICKTGLDLRTQIMEL